MLDLIKKIGGPAGKVLTAGQLLYKQFYKNEKDANKAYSAIFPTLRPLLQNLVEIRQSSLKY